MTKPTLTPHSDACEAAIAEMLVRLEQELLLPNCNKLAVEMGRTIIAASMRALAVQRDNGTDPREVFDAYAVATANAVVSIVATATGAPAVTHPDVVHNMGGFLARLVFEIEHRLNGGAQEAMVHHGYDVEPMARA